MFSRCRAEEAEDGVLEDDEHMPMMDGESWMDDEMKYLLLF